MQQILGLAPSWGSIAVYITSYLRSYDHTVTLNTTFLVNALTILTAGLSMEVGAILLNKINSKLHCVLATSVLFLSIYLSSLVQNSNMFIFLYSVCFGFGFGMVYMLTLRPAWVYFPEHKGMISGIILSCYGFGAIGWTQLWNVYCNPNNLSPDLEIDFGHSVEHMYRQQSEIVQNVQSMMTYCSYIIAVLGLIATALIRRKSEVFFSKRKYSRFRPKY